MAESPSGTWPGCRTRSLNHLPHRLTILAAGLALALLLACLHAEGMTAESEAKPNIVIILADDLGYGDLSTYGGWIEVPHIDRLAEEGVKLTDFHSNGPVCSPTRAALMTGRYQQRAGIPGVVFADPNRPEHEDGLQPHEVTFVELLKQAGYVTGIFGKWHLGYDRKYNPVRQGFDEFRGYVSGNVDYFSKVDQAGHYDWWHNERQVEEPGYTTQLITRHAVRFIEENKDGPFCVYIPHEAPHSPFQGPNDAPAGFRRIGNAPVRQGLSDEVVRRKFREMVVAMDEGIGEVVQTLKRLGIAERTLVVFFSDNGAARHGDNSPLRGGKGSLWEGGHRVPAVAWWPGRIAPGTVSDETAVSFDVMPTLLDLAGIDVPDGHHLDGVSLVPLLLKGEPLPERDLFWEYRGQSAVRQGLWKLLINARGPEETIGLYNLHEDLGEQTNLAEQYPERVSAMRQALKSWKQDVTTGATVQPSH